MKLIPVSAGVAAVFSLLVFAGCPRPEVNVPEVPGEAGEFCITVGDCAEGLSCLDRSCCQSGACQSTCSSLMAKDGTAAAAALARHPSMGRFFEKRCVSLCCKGAETSEIENHLKAWSRQIPAHGNAPGSAR